MDGAAGGRRCPADRPRRPTSMRLARLSRLRLGRRRRQRWEGIPLYLVVGMVDDEQKHDKGAFNAQAGAAAATTIEVETAGGEVVTIDSRDSQARTASSSPAKMDGGELPEEYFPLRLVGPGLSDAQMAAAYRTHRRAREVRRGGGEVVVPPLDGARRGRGPGPVALAVLLCFAVLARGCGVGQPQTQRSSTPAASSSRSTSSRPSSRQHPDVDVLTESHGSIQVLRQVTEFGDRLVDVAGHRRRAADPADHVRPRATRRPARRTPTGTLVRHQPASSSPTRPGATLAGELTAQTWHAGSSRAGRALRPRRPALRRRRLPRAHGAAARRARTTTTRSSSRTSPWAASRTPIRRRATRETST